VLVAYGERSTGVQHNLMAAATTPPDAVMNVLHTADESDPDKFVVRRHTNLLPSRISPLFSLRTFANIAPKNRMRKLNELRRDNAYRDCGFAYTGQERRPLTTPSRQMVIARTIRLQFTAFNGRKLPVVLRVFDEYARGHSAMRALPVRNCEPADSSPLGGYDRG